MGVDEALLRSPEAAWALRFYRWARPTVSLGYMQPFRRGIDESRARRLGVEVVRRPTGGRAVLHADEITYAIVAPTDRGPLAGGISSSYRRIARGLQAGLARLGAEVLIERAGVAPGRRSKGPCFAARTRYELSVQGRKMIGSAQRRVDARLLQHGSLLLGAPRESLWSALGDGYEDAAAASVGLDEIVAPRPSPRLLVACLAGGLADALGLPLRFGRLTAGERRTAVRLAARYRDPAWTRRR